MMYWFLVLLVYICGLLGGMAFATLRILPQIREAIATWPTVIMQPPPTPPVKPICTCHHGKGHHEDGKGRCYGIMTARVTIGRFECMTRCTCRVYTGPETLPELWIPEVHSGQ